MFEGSEIVMLSHILGFATGSNPSARIPPTQQEYHKCRLVTRQDMLRTMCLDAPLFTPFAWLSHLAVLSVAGNIVVTLTLMYSYLTERGRKSLTCPVYAVRTEWLMLRADEADRAGDSWPVDTGSGRGGRCRRRRSQPGDSSLSSVADKEPGLSLQSPAARSPTSAASLPVVCPAAAVA